MSTHSLTSEVGIWSRSHDLVGDFRILRMPSSDAGLKEDRVLLVILGLVAETAAYDCNDSDFHNFDTEKMSKGIG